MCIYHRFLAHGDSIHMIATNYQMGASILGEAIKPVCDAIWERLRPTMLPDPTEDLWKYQEAGFRMKWNFPHCIGAVDGKHIHIQQPPNTVSQYFNFKGFFSIVLLAVTGHDYRFTFVSVGGYGSSNDSALFEATAFCRHLESADLHVPDPCPLPDDPRLKNIPFVVLGDDAFKLTKNVMKSYVGRRVTDLYRGQRVFNYRVSSARRVVENAFGILCSRWRIFHPTIYLSPDKVDSVVKACVVLHNLLTKEDDEITRSVSGGLITLEGDHSATDLVRTNAVNPSNEAKRVRDYFKDYMMAEGAVDFQEERAMLQPSSLHQSSTQ